MSNLQAILDQGQVDNGAMVALDVKVNTLAVRNICDVPHAAIHGPLNDEAEDAVLFSIEWKRWL